MSAITLIKPLEQHLPSYVSALQKGWSPDNLSPEAAEEELAKIAEDSAAYLDSLDDPDARGGPVRLPDGSLVPRLPGLRRFIWDGGFCGFIGFRWQEKTSELPPHVLGHVGFGIVPWKRGNGYAKQALRAILPIARQKGLCHIELTTTPDNVASQRVVLACGGELIERFELPAAFGVGEALRFRIPLDDA